MAGFEVIVRPVVFPSIRPAPAQPLAPANDPEQGLAILGGSGGGLIDLNVSEQASWSRSKNVETKRRYDVARVWETSRSGPPGTGPLTREGGEGYTEDDPHIDIEVLNKVWLRDGNGVMHERRYANIQEAENIQIIQRNVTRNN